jgi:hypothetical protein
VWRGGFHGQYENDITMTLWKSMEKTVNNMAEEMLIRRNLQSAFGLYQRVSGVKAEIPVAK